MLLVAARVLKTGYSVVQKNVFQANWSTFTNSMLRGLNWTGVVAAGGSVLGVL